MGSEIVFSVKLFYIYAQKVGAVLKTAKPVLKMLGVTA